ncbi:MAG: prepilin-type N-terminal cleavage/methylation domain-containing protein [Planctomycetota bacterium]
MHLPDLISRLSSSSREARGRRGFTLIELLVVIAIILIIVGLATFAIIPMMTRAKLTRSINSIRTAESGFERFVLAFGQRRYGGGTRSGYPKNDELSLTGQAPRCDAEMMRIFLLPTETELTGMFKNTKIDKAVLDFSEAKEALNNGEIVDNGETYKVKSIFVDGWEQPLRYRFPGRNHSLEKTFLDDKDGPGSGNNNLQSARPDIWSVGADGESFYEDNNVAEWPGEVNDPNKNGKNDDVTNWFPIDRY